MCSDYYRYVIFGSLSNNIKKKFYFLIIILFIRVLYNFIYENNYLTILKSIS